MNKTASADPIPLYRPDLTQRDEQAVLSQIERAPFRDDAQLLRWEAAWSDLWERPAVAFADHQEPVRLLKTILGWRSGDVVGGDLLLDPAWREALESAWLHLGVRDVDGLTGQAVGECQIPPDSGILQAVLMQHPFGLPTPRPASDTWTLEEISALLRPMEGCGDGAIQLLNLEGPRILPVGTGCVLLSRDQGLMDQLAKLRHYPPSGTACALGLSQLAGLMHRLQRRQELAERYLTLRLQDKAILPFNPKTGRVWEGFFLTLKDQKAKCDLEAFLTRSAIGCGSPVWFQPRAAPGLGTRRFLDCTLALPLYASLSDTHCKRIINRIHRWVGRYESV